MTVLAQGHVARPDSNLEVKPGAQGAKFGEAPTLGGCVSAGCLEGRDYVSKNEDTPPQLPHYWGGTSPPLELLTKGDLQAP